MERDGQNLACPCDFTDQLDVATPLGNLLEADPWRMARRSRLASLRSLGMDGVQLHRQHQGRRLSQPKRCQGFSLKMQCGGFLKMPHRFIQRPPLRDDGDF